MRRMNEVFALPIETDMLVRDIAYGLLDTADESAIAHAINHVDSLADALDALFQSYKALADSGDAGNWSVEDLDEGKKAIAALAAYRGGK